MAQYQLDTPQGVRIHVIGDIMMLTFENVREVTLGDVRIPGKTAADSDGDVSLPPGPADRSRQEFRTGRRDARLRVGDRRLHPRSGETERRGPDHRIPGAASAPPFEAEGQDSKVLLKFSARRIAALVLALEKNAFGITDQGLEAQSFVMDLQRLLDTSMPDWRTRLWPSR
jgi:hypothetical protein